MKGSQIASKLTSNRQVMLQHGIGCSDYDNCFACPFSKCRFNENKIDREKTANVVLYTDGLDYSKRPI